MKSRKKKKNAFKRICKEIYLSFDKTVIVPISTFVFKIQNKLGKDSKIEKLLNRPNALLIISLIFAIVLFCLVDNKAISLINKDAKFLTNVPVEVEYNSSAYVIEGVPETVDMTLIGKKSEIYLAEQLGDKKVTLDLLSYEASDNPVKVKLFYNKPINNVDYQITPGYVTVTIKKKVGVTRTISYDLMNQDKLDPKLSVKSVDLSKSDVIVRGSEETVNKIANIKALVDLGDEEFTRKGTYTLDNLKLVAYTADGKVVDNVEIVGSNISAKVELDSYHKTVPVKVQINGEIVSGKAVSKIEINNEDISQFETIIYGDEASLENISEIPVSIDASGLGNNGQKEFKVTFAKPAGVRSIKDESVSIKLHFGEAKQRTIVIHGIKTVNVPNGLVANLASQKETEVEVQIIGVESVMNEITQENSENGINAYVDLTGKTVGTHTVPVKIVGSDPRLQYIVTKDVNVIISKK